MENIEKRRVEEREREGTQSVEVKLKRVIDMAKDRITSEAKDKCSVGVETIKTSPEKMTCFQSVNTVNHGKCLEFSQQLNFSDFQVVFILLNILKLIVLLLGAGRKPRAIEATRGE